MRLNVNKLLHTPGSRQDIHFEMDLSDLEFGGTYPVTRPVVVDGQLRNQAGMLLCELQITTTLHCICDRCAQAFDQEKSTDYACVLAEERQSDEDDDSFDGDIIADIADDDVELVDDDEDMDMFLSDDDNTEE